MRSHDSTRECLAVKEAIEEIIREASWKARYFWVAIPAAIVITMAACKYLGDCPL